MFFHLEIIITVRMIQINKTNTPAALVFRQSEFSGKERHNIFSKNKLYYYNRNKFLNIFVLMIFVWHLC